MKINLQKVANIFFLVSIIMATGAAWDHRTTTQEKGCFYYRIVPDFNYTEYNSTEENITAEEKQKALKKLEESIKKPYSDYERSKTSPFYGE